MNSVLLLLCCNDCGTPPCNRLGSLVMNICTMNVKHLVPLNTTTTSQTHQFLLPVKPTSKQPKEPAKTSTKPLCVFHLPFTCSSYHLFLTPIPHTYSPHCIYSIIALFHHFLFKTQPHPQWPRQCFVIHSQHTPIPIHQCVYGFGQVVTCSLVRGDDGRW